MSYETILVEEIDGVTRITLNRPERLNAWTYQMGAELSAAVAAANENDDVIAMVVTGAGRGFCAGADIGDVFKAQSEGQNVRGDNTPRDWVGEVRAAKPMVAAINGAAIGVGLTQVLPMDYLVAAEDAKLSVRFVKMGLVPELASSHYLALRMGFGHASELMLSGRTLTGREALAIGLVDRVTSADELLPTAHAVARGMGENPQSSLRAIKDLITQNASEGDLAEVQKREMAALAEAYKSPEHKEAIAAFLEKREPDFRAARKGA
ncbi:MAG: enoyl-CoA hydratase-related protein [Pseudomonadales bacterium]|jgi:2-(1,2-epoxy-1,2-dihydrophenyl)acetyl-CoA isomerase